MKKKEKQKVKCNSEWEDEDWESNQDWGKWYKKMYAKNKR